MARRYIHKASLPHQMARERLHLWNHSPSHKEDLPQTHSLTGNIDCFEIFLEAPSNLKSRAQVWSSYKRHITMKLLIPCNLLGAINFLSRAWGGRVSDIKLVNKTEFLTKLPHHPRDQILTDRGFTMKDKFACIAGVELLTPAFIKGRDQFCAHDGDISVIINCSNPH